MTENTHELSNGWILITKTYTRMSNYERYLLNIMITWFHNNQDNLSLDKFIERVRIEDKWYKGSHLIYSELSIWDRVPYMLAWVGDVQNEKRCWYCSTIQVNGRNLMFLKDPKMCNYEEG